MTGGSLLSVPATVGIALAPGYGWFLAAWLVAGIAMAATFYQAAFAAVTYWDGERRGRGVEPGVPGGRPATTPLPPPAPPPPAPEGGAGGPPAAAPPRPA